MRRSFEGGAQSGAALKRVNTVSTNWNATTSKLSEIGLRHRWQRSGSAAGLADNVGADEDVFSEFKEQLKRSEDGSYETSLPRKPGHQLLLSNPEGNLRRLNSLLRKLRRADMLPQYDAVMQEQIDEGIVEKAPAVVTGKEFYLPRRAVIREHAETTKTRIVYDASARKLEDSPSFNECLVTGPPLHNQL